MVRRKRKVTADFPVPARLLPGSDLLRADPEAWRDQRYQWFRTQGEQIRAAISPLEWIRETREVIRGTRG